MLADPVRIFIGFDSRQPLAYNVLQSSLHRHSKRRLQIEPLMLGKLPITPRGLTEFTYSRFLVPWLCDYQGTAIFMDADIVVTGDIGELLDQADGRSAVQVMQDQPRFEWPSVMLFNNKHCKRLSPEYVNNPETDMLSLNWGEIGTFTREWNYCVGYDQGEPDAKLLHFTQGIPCWFETAETDPGEVWEQERIWMNFTVPWADLMAKSVHAKPVIARLLKRYGIEIKPVA